MKKVLLFAAAVMAFASCVKDEPVYDGNLEGQENLVTIHAGVAKTKTQIVDGTDVQWTPGDKIKMCFEVKNWQNSCSWTGVEFENNGESVSESAFFTGSVDVNIAQDYGFVVYPTSFKFESRTGSNSANYTTTISHVLPSVQPAVEGTFANNLNLSYAPVTKKQVSDNISSKTPINVTFKNICALIKVTLPAENYNVKEILVESANGLTGEYSMLWEASLTKQTLKLNSFKSEVKEVTIANEDGSNLTPGASYYAVVWPGQHSGLTFTFTDDKGLECVKDLSKTVNCEVGKITEINVKTLTFKEAEPELTTNNSSLNFAAAGGSSSFSFNTNKKWTITEIPGWLTLDQTSGEPSKDAISVNATCAENTAYTSRTANITISAGGLTKTINVTQEAAVKTISLSVSTTSLSVSGQGGTASFTVTCNDNWTITNIPDYVTLSRTSGTESASAVTVNVTVKQNFVYGNRNKSFTVTAGDQVKYISVNQNGPTSYSIGSQVSKAGDLQDGQPYIIESNKYAGLYWKWQSSNLKYCKWNSAGVQTIMCTFIYHRDDSKGKSGDTNYKSWSTGIWEAAASSGQYLNSNWKFASISEAKYIANSNCWGTETGKEFDMCEVGKTTSVCYTNTSTENGGNYYWGNTSEQNRKWKVYKAVPQY